jgi:hypothetical protein
MPTARDLARKDMKKMGLQTGLLNCDSFFRNNDDYEENSIPHIYSQSCRGINSVVISRSNSSSSNKKKNKKKKR